MSTLSAFIEELNEAKEFEFDRIEGFLELTGIPATMLSDATRIKIIAASDWSKQRNNLLGQVIDALTKLADHKYPERPKQTTSADILAELAELERLFDLAVDEFAPEPAGAKTGSSTIVVKPV
jgi:hypothetical protein